jgi:hypothetical protein
MNVSGITAALPAQDLSRAEAFYLEKVGLEAVQSSFLNASDGRVGVVVGGTVNQIVLYPAEAKSSGQFLQAVLQVTDVGAVVEEMRGRGVRFEEYDTGETHTENGSNLVGVVSALARQGPIRSLIVCVDQQRDLSARSPNHSRRGETPARSVSFRSGRSPCRLRRVSERAEPSQPG